MRPLRRCSSHPQAHGSTHQQLESPPSKRSHPRANGVAPKHMESPQGQWSQPPATGGSGSPCDTWVRALDEISREVSIVTNFRASTLTTNIVSSSKMDGARRSRRFGGGSPIEAPARLPNYEGQRPTLPQPWRRRSAPFCPYTRSPAADHVHSDWPASHENLMLR